MIWFGLQRDLFIAAHGLRVCGSYRELSWHSSLSSCVDSPAFPGTGSAHLQRPYKSGSPAIIIHRSRFTGRYHHCSGHFAFWKKSPSGRNLYTCTSCELPVDHLYAVLGLFELRLQRGMAEAGLIDSSRPYWQIVILFNVWYLSTSGIFLLLPYASQPDKHSSIPSCCADWSTPFGEVKEVGMHSSYHASLAVGARSERTNPAVEVILSSDSIRLSGFCVDGIHEVVSPTPNWEQWNLN